MTFVIPTEFFCFVFLNRQIEGKKNFERFFFEISIQIFQITEWSEVDKLKSLVKIQTVYFERNPIHKETSYRTKLKLALPTLIQIDATPCR